MKRAIFGLAAVLLAANPSNSGADGVAPGKAQYDTACAPCHGAGGAGDGPSAAALPPGTIRNLVTGPFRFATDAGKLKEIVQKGGAAVGLSPLMPAQPTRFSGRELEDLAAFVLGLRQKHASR